MPRAVVPPSASVTSPQGAAPVVAPQRSDAFDAVAATTGPTRPAAVVAPPPAASLDETKPGVLAFRGKGFDVELDAATGTIRSITDPRTGTELSVGSRNGVMWGALFDDGSYLGSTYDGASRTDQPFTVAHRWDPVSSTLTLDYVWKGSPSKLAAHVTLKPAADGAFDLALSLDNNTGRALRRVLFPSDLLFKTDALQKGYGAFTLPGSQFDAGDFANLHVSAETGGVGAVDHFMHLDVGGSHLAIYPVTGRDDPPLQSAFGFDTNDAQTVTMKNELKTLWGPGTYRTPPMRIRVGAPVEQTVADSRVDKGVSDYPDLKAKLGAKLPLQQRAVTVKVEGVPFRELINTLDRYPSPTNLHLVGGTPGGHDKNYPLLELDPRLGTWDDLKAFIGAAHAHGDLVSIYTNKLWWTKPGPGFDRPHPGYGEVDIAARRADGSIQRASWNGTDGDVVSQQTAYAQEVTRAMMNKLREVGIDQVFGDQEGALQVDEDFNPAEPNPLAFRGSFVASAEIYRSMAPGTEFGDLRLARPMAELYGTRWWDDADRSPGPGARRGTAAGVSGARRDS
jgi:hypothetical protein